ncbi:MAG: hypothetical protein WC856_23060 [Methylococcaceae bacterium]
MSVSNWRAQCKGGALPVGEIPTRLNRAGRKQSEQSWVQQAKLVASFRVRVPDGKGLTTHPYRVLRFWRSVAGGYSSDIETPSDEREGNR